MLFRDAVCCYCWESILGEPAGQAVLGKLRRPLGSPFFKILNKNPLGNTIGDLVTKYKKNMFNAIMSYINSWWTTFVEACTHERAEHGLVKLQLRFNISLTTQSALLLQVLLKFAQRLKRSQCRAHKCICQHLKNCFWANCLRTTSSAELPANYLY